MKVSGSQTLSEGKINENLVASGLTRINGNFECEEFKSSGTLRGEGSISVNGDFQCTGSFKLGGSLSVEGKAKSSGTTTIDGEMLIKGSYTKSGTLKVLEQVKAIEGAKMSGFTKIQGNLLSDEDVDLRGNAVVGGNIKAENVFIGMVIDDFRPFKHPYKVHGNIVAENEIAIKKTFVGGDIEGRDVKIGKGTEVLGTVYYLNTIEVNPRANLSKKPIKVKDR